MVGQRAAALPRCGSSLHGGRCDGRTGKRKDGSSRRLRPPYADLAAVTAGIPVGLAGARLPRRPPRRQLSNAARWGISGLFTPVVLAAAAAFAWLGGDGRSEPVAFVIAFAYFVFWLSTGADMLWQWHCASVPTAGICVRCAHTAASHPARASCAARPGSLTVWRRCQCAGYVPPGISPETADLGSMAVTG